MASPKQSTTIYTSLEEDSDKMKAGMSRCQYLMNTWRAAYTATA